MLALLMNLALAADLPCSSDAVLDHVATLRREEVATEPLVAAIRGLAHCRDPRALPFLAPIVEDTRVEARVAVAVATRAWPNEPEASHIANRLATDSATPVRRAALGALGVVTPTWESEYTLVALATDTREHESLRRAAAATLESRYSRSPPPVVVMRGERPYILTGLATAVFAGGVAGALAAGSDDPATPIAAGAAAIAFGVAGGVHAKTYAREEDEAFQAFTSATLGAIAGAATTHQLFAPGTPELNRLSLMSGIAAGSGSGLIAAALLPAPAYSEQAEVLLFTWLGAFAGVSATPA